MRVALVFPNYAMREEFGDATDPPLGVATIAAVLEQQGHAVLIVDANAENLGVDLVLSRLRGFQPDTVGISCNYAPLHNPSLRLAEQVKKVMECAVVLGGNHATALAGYLLASSPSVDYVVRGEGDVVLPQLLNCLDEGLPLRSVPGITYRENGAVTENPDAPLAVDLDQVPMPAYHLLPMDKYQRYNILTSRGCPYRCSYCASNVVFRRTVRYRSPQQVLSEVHHLLKTYGAKHLWFSDDTFTSNTRYTRALLETMRERRLTAPWSCMTRINMVSRALLAEMKSAGCAYISYGIESGNEEMLRQIGKGITVRQIVQSLRLTHEVGMRQYGFFIVGFPGETWRTVMDSYKLVYDSPMDGAAFNILIPLPGTRVMDDLLANGAITREEIEWDHLFARIPNETYETYAAQLAARWTELSWSELLEACKLGRRLPDVFRYVRSSSPCAG